MAAQPSKAQNGAGIVPRTTPYASLYIDATWRQWFEALASSLTLRNHDQLESLTISHWAPAQKLEAENKGTALAKANIMVTLSVRSALDLYLQVRNFPAGSHVLMSAINIPDVSLVLKHHNLIPIPIDVDVATLSPDMDALEKVLSAL